MMSKYANKFFGFWLWVCLITTAFLIQGIPETVAAEQEPPPIYVIRIEGAVSPGTAGFLHSSIEKAQEAGAQALLIELDTPGGLLQSTRTMVKDIMNAPVPVIIYVSPTGAQAASAGVFVTMSADIAVMAPGTNIGAAHPVGTGGKDVEGDMAKKVVNDTVAFAQGIAKERGRNVGWVKKAIEKSISVTASEAVLLEVVDFEADHRSELLEKINGRTVERGNIKVTLNTTGAALVELQETLRDRILRTLADPNIAYILMMLGLAGLYFELSHPGTILPGVVGGMCLILAFYSFQTLPVNYAGILLIILGIILFILEMKITSFGMLSIGGLISLTLGSLMLFETPEEYMRVSLGLMIPVLFVFSGFFLLLTYLVVKSQARAPQSGVFGLVGLVGPVKEWEGKAGKVLVHGEWWHADSDDQLQPGDKISVTAVNGMRLVVRRVDRELESE